MRQTMYLIRHGHTEGTENGILYGATELPVTEEGLERLSELAESGIYPDPEGAALHTSGMLRTEQTFRTIYGDIRHGTVPGLKEIDLGIYEMKKVQDILKDEYGKAWLEGRIDNPVFEGGESLDEFQLRVRVTADRVMKDAASEGVSRVILVVHGGVITYVMEGFFPGTYDDMWEWSPEPGLGYRVDFEDGRPLGWSPIETRG